MPKSRFSLVFLALLFWSVPACAQGPSDSDRLFSPSVGQKFYEIAYELANPGDTKPEKEILGPPEDVRPPSSNHVEQAITFLTATKNLDSTANYVYPLLIELTCQYSARDHSELVHHLLAGYIDQSADLEVAEKAIRYLLDRLNSREQREQLLEGLLKNLGGKNRVLGSELATLLGLLMAEKADTEAAQFHFMYAFNNNKHNKLAFAKLAELVPEQISPAMYLEQLRLALGRNPLDMEAAFTFAQYAERLQLYQTAADAYEYCTDLFGFLHPSQALPAQLYLPWAISSYNTQRNQHKCLQIAEQLRQNGRFDLLLEAIAGKAAAKIGDAEQANRIFQAAQEQAQQLLTDDSSSRQVLSEQLAWFYCFASPDADKAIDNANRAYSIEPNSTMAASILAYSLVMNGQTDWARPLIDNYEKNQIADLALAQIQLKEGQKDSAIETLKSVIAADPGSLEAEWAKKILAQHGGEYIPPTDPDIILTTLRNTFGQAVVPAFISPEKIISVQLSVRGSKFSYGSKFDGSVAITNNSSRPLIISDDGLLKGNIRVDADITGDLNKKIPNLVSIKIRPTLPIEPDRSILIPLRLVTAELKQILLTYPQASLDIEFTVFIDPVTDGQGRITNNLQSIEPAKVAVKRPGVELSGRFLRNRLNSLSKGRQGQKIKTAQLFAGLLAEQHTMDNREPLYESMHADWMPALLKSALIYNLADDDWVVKVHTMGDMLSVPMDYELINAAAENLNDINWPARLMAVYLLAKSQDSNFDNVLDHYAKYDQSRFVRDMAIALGAAVPPETAETTK